MAGISVSNKKRAADMLEFFQQRDFDVIALQEVYHKVQRKELIEWLQNHHYVVKCEGKNPSLKIPFVPFTHTIDTTQGGLLLAVKEKITPTLAHLFTPYENISNHLDEKISGRGYVKTWLTVNQKRVLFVLTHLAHRPADEASRLLQLNQLLHDTDLQLAEHVVLLGDFNMKPDSAAYEMVALAGFTDAGRVHKDDTHTYDLHNPFVMHHHLSGRIDYMWYKSPHIKSEKYELAKSIGEHFFSDHYGITLELNV